jgi:hypothetical protein
MNASSSALQAIEMAYLGVTGGSNSVDLDQPPDLLHLVWLGHGIAGLNIDDLAKTGAGVDVVAASNAFGEAQPSQQGAQILEPDTSIGRSGEDLCKYTIRPAHPGTLPSRAWPGESGNGRKRLDSDD